MEKEIEGFAPGARPLCPFCSAPWTDDMIVIEDNFYSYDSGAGCNPELEIKCSSCHRLIYKK